MSNLNLLSPINKLSYGIVGRNLTRELVKLGKEIALWPIGNPDCDQEEIAVLQQCVKNQDNYNVNADCIRIYHQFGLDQFVGKGRHIGYPIFELDSFNERELNHLASCDGLFVCSNWAKEIVEKSLGMNRNQVDVVPLGVDRTKFNPEIIHMHVRKDKDPFVFLSIVKWEVRKSHQELCEAFNKAFSPADNVELWLMSHNYFCNELEIKEWENLFLNSPMGGKVQFIPPVQTSSDVAQLILHSDCGISLSKAEGWDLPILEMMSCGKPVITTNFSAHTEFCTKENAMLVEIQETEPAFDGKWFFGQGNWAAFGENQIEQTVENMRKVFQGGKKQFNSAGVETAKKFTWENSAKTILNVL